jgi:Bacterial extracellular solute-binding proteins, family 5 Middle
VGFIVCLQATTWACSSRSSTTAGVPVPPQADRPTAPPTTITPEPPESPPAATTPPSDPDADDCALIAAPGEPIVTVALSDRINSSNAPHPSNESERLLFRQLYDTLIRVDCMGRVRPGLAASWRLDGDGRTWIVALRENAYFSDGTPVTAADVRTSWTRDGIGGELRQHVSSLVQSIVPVGERALAITLRSRRVDVPMALAHPDLAVAKSVADSSWPLGTRSARIAPDSDAPRTTAASVTITRDGLPPIRFLIAPGDPRDLLDDGVDLLLTRDPAALDYAATLPQFQLVPLAWQRTHVLLTPGRSRSSPLLPENARQVLADDAVRGEARGARGPFWWEVLTDCEVPLSSPPNQSSPTPRIVYDASDAAARDLAERLVGLVRASGPAAFLDVLLPDRPRRTYQRATGLTGEALARARRLGTDAGYVVSVESRPVDPCRDLRALMDGARWLDPETIVPLVETRMQAIVRRGRAGVTAEWDGGLVIARTNGSR